MATELRDEGKMMWMCPITSECRFKQVRVTFGFMWDRNTDLLGANRAFSRPIHHQSRDTTGHFSCIVFVDVSPACKIGLWRMHCTQFECVKSNTDWCSRAAWLCSRLGRYACPKKYCHDVALRGLKKESGSRWLLLAVRRADVPSRYACVIVIPSVFGRDLF